MAKNVSRRNSPAPASPSPAPDPQDAGKAKDAKAEKPKESTRDFVEQIVVAIILAILIRGFEAEAFVIPTGSMAPTLKGRHLELSCDQCGYTYTVSADERSEGYVLANPGEDTAVCGNCRYQTRTPKEPRFKGDRILVMKFPYEFPTLPGSSAPERWDVIVFHYPEEPETNYIKRMVGLPNDEMKVSFGDLHARPADTNEPFKILRKPLEHQQAMQMTVYDDNHRAKALKSEPAWQRWQAVKSDWSEKTPGEFTSPSASEDWSMLRYQHVVPDPEQWGAILNGRALPRQPRKSLITDFYSYNATTTGEPRNPAAAWLQHNWVGDLTVSCRVVSESDQGVVKLELVEAGVTNRCEINLATGMAELFHGDQKLGEAATALKGQTWADLQFANVDDRLTLWVNGATPFGEGLEYDDGPVVNFGPKAEDLNPVAVAVKGGAIRVSDLVLKRDIYYTQEAGTPDVSIPASFGAGFESDLAPIIRMYDVLSDPARYTPLMANIPTRSFRVSPNHYMMMGDNSPRSSDSRMWGRRDANWAEAERESWEVPREMLVGKAFFVYWPHGVPFWPNIGIGRFPTSRDFRVPFRPYIERMRPIR